MAREKKFQGSQFCDKTLATFRLTHKHFISWFLRGNKKLYSPLLNLSIFIVNDGLINKTAILLWKKSEFTTTELLAD